MYKLRAGNRPVSTGEERVWNQSTTIRYLVTAAALAGVASGCATPTEEAGGGTPAAPRYSEIAAASGIDHAFKADADFVVGGGAAAFDCDADGDMDLAVAGGLEPAALFENRTAGPGDVAFARVSGFGEKLGARVGRATGVYAIDIDGDGRDDLVVTRFKRNLVLKNDGECRFSDVTAAWGLEDTGTWTTAFAADWTGTDALPVLVFGNYVKRDQPLRKTGNCEPTRILYPAPNATGRNPAYLPAEELTPSHCALSLLFLDWRGDGRADLRVSNDRQYADPDGAEQLVTLSGGQRHYGEAEGWRTDRIWGMGLAAADIDGDGHPEIAATNMAENRLYVREDPKSDAPAYVNESWPRGAAAQRPYTGGDVRPSTSWHAAFADLNNDARDDLLIVKGNVDRMKQFAAFDPDSLLLGDGAGSFAEAGDRAGLALERTGRGGAVFDADGDGCLDILVVNRNQPVSLFHNTSCGALPPAVSADLQGAGGNRHAVGARVTLTAGDSRVERDVTIGGGHGGSGLTPFHAGLGGADTGTLQVRWPDGTLSAAAPVQGGLHYRWRQGEPAPQIVRKHAE